MLWSSFELPSASKTSVMSNRGLVELLLLSWPPSGTLDNDLARCLSLATALCKERRMLNPGLPAVCKESEPPLPPGANDRSLWPVPLSSPLAVLAFAPILHAAKQNTRQPTKTAVNGRRDHEILAAFVCTRAPLYYERFVYSWTSTITLDDIDRWKPTRGRDDRIVVVVQL